MGALVEIKYDSGNKQEGKRKELDVPFDSFETKTLRFESSEDIERGFV